MNGIKTVSGIGYRGSMLVPSVYLYEIRAGKHCLYLGDYTTSEGLRLVSPNSQLRIVHMWAEKVHVLPEPLAGVLCEALLANCRRYVKINSDGVINFYDSFDHYLIRLR